MTQMEISPPPAELEPDFGDLAAQVFQILDTTLKQKCEEDAAYPQTVEGLQYAFRLVWKRYDSPRPELPDVFYHSLQHTIDVVLRALKIAQAMYAADPTYCSTRDVLLTALYSAFHDIVQGKGSGANEAESAIELTDWMDTRYRVAEKELGRRAIMATVALPVFDEDQHFAGVVQPALEIAATQGHTLPAPVGALALADLGSTGMGTKDSWIAESCRLLCEQNESFRKAIQDKTATALHVEIFNDWIKQQSRFARHRTESFRREITVIPEKVRTLVTALFFNFVQDEHVSIPALLENFLDSHTYLTDPTRMTTWIRNILDRSPTTTHRLVDSHSP